MIFYPIRLTDDDALVTASEASVKAAGVIRAELRRCAENEPREMPVGAPVDKSVLTWHEESKKYVDSPRRSSDNA